jgi:hypothetical protein
MASETPVTILDVYAVDDETADETQIGKVGYGPNGMLSVLDVETAHLAPLRQAVAIVNRKAALVEMIPPGPNAPPFAVSTRVVQRTDRDFFKVLQRHLLKYYGLSLG